METLSYCQLMERMLAAEARVVELAAERDAATLEYDYLNDQIEYWKNKSINITEQRNELESRTVKLPDDAEHDIMAPVAAYLSEKFKWDGGAARWDGRKEYDVLADRVKYALRMVIRRAAGIKVEAE